MFQNLSPHFWVGLVLFIISGIGGGTIHLTNIVPMDWIPGVTAWAALLNTVGTGYLTVALGLQSNPSNKGDTK